MTPMPTTAAATTTTTVDITTGSTATIISGFTTTTTATAIPAAHTAAIIPAVEVTRPITTPTIVITRNLSTVTVTAGALHIMEAVDRGAASGATPGRCRNLMSRTASAPLRISAPIPPVPVPAVIHPSPILRSHKSPAHHLLRPVLQETAWRDHQGLPLPPGQAHPPRPKRPQVIRVHRQKLHLRNQSARTELPSRSQPRFFPPLPVPPQIFQTDRTA